MNDDAPPQASEKHGEPARRPGVGHRKNLLTFSIPVDHQVSQIAGMVTLRIPVAMAPGATGVQVRPGRLEGGGLAASDFMEVDPVGPGRKPINPHGYLYPVASLVERDGPDVLSGCVPQRDSSFGGWDLLRGGVAAGSDKEQSRQDGEAHSLPGQDSE